MIIKYLVIAKRILLRKLVFTLLNILGLSIGIASSALVFLYINYEKSFDRYHTNSENIYRLSYGRTTADGSNVEFASACPVIGPLLKENFPEIIDMARMAVREATLAFDENKFIEKKIYYAEQDIFKILNFKIVSGSIENTLNQPNNIVISQSIAEKYFGNDDPVGKNLRMNRAEDFRVVAVFEDVPQNSHLKPEILMSFPNLAKWRGDDYLLSWGHTGAFTYLTLDPSADPRALEKKFIEYTKSQIGELLEKWNMIFYFNLQPIESIHLNSHLLQEQEENGDARTVNFMYIIGLFILVIAWVNYINLTTSRSMERAREVGIRKVTGAVRSNLINQFYVESALINLISTIFALFIIEILSNSFSQLTGIPEAFSIWDMSWFYIFIGATYLFGTFITGMYPVFAVSSFKPIQILKGSFARNKGVFLRRAIVVIQLSISLVLIVGTYTVFSQLEYLQKQSLGFSFDQTLVVNVPKAVDSTYVKAQSVFKQEVNKLPGVNGVAFSTEVPGRKIWWDNGGIFKVGLDQSAGKNYMIMGVDEHFIDLYGLKFVKGRNFSLDFPSDKEAVIINETAMQWLEFKNPDEAVGGQINYWGNIYTVIGVLKDYHHESPKVTQEPQIFRFIPDIPRGCFSIKLQEASLTNNLMAIEGIWNKLFEGNPFEYFFLDTYYGEQLNPDKKFGKVFGIFSSLAIFITCLGLFGLSLYTAQLKTKEIGVRKVFGATYLVIVTHILKEYLLLLFVALIIVIPILFWGIMLWLNNFPIRMSITIWLFIVPLAVVLVITMISVASHTLKAAKQNPVDSLKYE